jgi:hypothetical protein
VATVSRRVGELLVRSKIGPRWRRDHFRRKSTPTHKVTVENRYAEEFHVEVEIATESNIVLINGAAPPWRSKKIPHGGLRSHGKRDWDYHAKLSFTGSDLNQQIMHIKVYMAPSWWAEDEPLPLLDHFPHAIWVK